MRNKALPSLATKELTMKLTEEKPLTKEELRGIWRCPHCREQLSAPDFLRFKRVMKATWLSKPKLKLKAKA